jgi:hypothetical protein
LPSGPTRCCRCPGAEITGAISPALTDCSGRSRKERMPRHPRSRGPAQPPARSSSRAMMSCCTSLAPS